MQLEDYMTTRQAADELDMKPFSVLRAVQRGTFKGTVKVGHFHLIPKAEVARVKEVRRLLRELQGEETA